MTVVLGIDLAAGRGITEVAVLSVDGDGLPFFDALCHHPVSADSEIVAAVEAARPAVIAIDAPLTLPRAVQRGLQQAHSTPAASPISPRAGGPAASVTASPYTRAAERDPIWRSIGIRPLPVSFLGGLTFRAISLVPALRIAAPRAAIIEVFPSATLRQLGVSQRTAGKRSSKTSVTSRRSTQSGLSRFILGIVNPDDDLYSTDLLDALAAALTGLAYARGAFRLAGDADEGAIVVLDGCPSEK